MRDALPRGAEADRIEPDHIGLAYGAWAPFAQGGKIPDKERASWLARLAKGPVSPDYRHAFDRWTSSFGPCDWALKFKLVSRLLVGHGNPGPTDVGLTVHHTWGVPVIPGSALKGLLAHYVDAVYGPLDLDQPRWEQPDGERVRVPFGGVTWNDRRIRRGPGRLYRAIFGAPEAEDDRALRERGEEAGPTRGLVVFHDALYVPESADGRPFAGDVLTVHQKPYYDSGDSARASWPNDFDDPNPVAFLTVRPGVQLLVAVSGPSGWSELAGTLLACALEEWGVGGKGSSGYGRLIKPGLRGTAEEAGAGPRYRKGDRIRVTRVQDPSGKGKVKFRADDGVLGHFVDVAPEVAIGESMDVWIANIGAQTYTLIDRPASASARPPRGRRR